MTDYSFLVQYCENWDGGEQEREAASRFIKETIPTASITSRKVDNYPITVKLFQLVSGQEKEIFQCRQQDLFRKNNWPAKTGMVSALKRCMK